MINDNERANDTRSAAGRSREINDNHSLFVISCGPFAAHVEILVD